MARSVVETEMHVILTLSKKEAYYLKKQFQNAVAAEHPTEIKAREAIFNALPSFEKLS